jgi:hypothetical protein
MAQTLEYLIDFILIDLDQPEKVLQLVRADDIESNVEHDLIRQFPLDMRGEKGLPGYSDEAQGRMDELLIEKIQQLFRVAFMLDLPA